MVIEQCELLRNPRGNKIFHFHLIFKTNLNFLAKHDQISSYFNQNRYKIIQKIKIFDGGNAEGRRAILFLPSKIDSSFLKRPNINYLNDDLAFHWACINYDSI